MPSIDKALFFPINKFSKIMQTYGISLENIEIEIKATQAFLEKFCSDGYNTSTREIAKNVDIDSTFTETRHRKKTTV